MQNESRLSELAESSRQLLEGAVKLHGEILALMSSRQQSSATARLINLFRTSISEVEKPLTRNEALVPGIFFSFEEDTNCIATIKSRPSLIENGVHPLEISLVDPGKSGWFTLQINLRWSEIRLARRLECSITASSSKELRCRAALSGCDIEGKWREFGTAPFILKDEPTVASPGFELAVPHTVPFNEQKWPRLIIDFELTKFNILFNHIDIKLM